MSMLEEDVGIVIMITTHSIPWKLIARLKPVYKESFLFVLGILIGIKATLMKHQGISFILVTIFNLGGDGYQVSFHMVNFFL